MVRWSRRLRRGWRIGAGGRKAAAGSVGALSLLTDKARAYSDGYLYSIIRYGRGLMPRYGDKVYRHEDRWAVVNYVRQLQRAGAPPSPSVP